MGPNGRAINVKKIPVRILDFCISAERVRVSIFSKSMRIYCAWNSNAVVRLFLDMPFDIMPLFIRGMREFIGIF